MAILERDNMGCTLMHNGALAAGKVADALLVRTDPLANIRSLEDPANIALVMQDGKLVKDIREAA